MTDPAVWETDAVLADGGTVTLRPIRPDDADALRAMHARLSADTVYMRFFSMVRVLSDKEVAHLTQVDMDRRIALVALLRGELVGVVRCDRMDEVTAEVAVVVEDAHQGRGLGPLLLEHLAAAAADRGVERFVANVLPSNRRMLTVFRSAGFEVERHMADGYVELSYPIEPTTASVSVARSREHRAEARSVARLLAPRSVAVLGASRQPGSAGHEVLRALLEQGFTGRVHAVNPAAEEVLGVRCVARIGDVDDDELDLVVIAVPAAQVPAAVVDCAARGVHGLVVVAGGFADGGAAGQERLAEVVRTARGAGMRLVGPNAMGVVNTDPQVRLHATFAAGRALPGRVGVFTQSGALAGAVLTALERRRLGLSTFVSIGDRADVSGNDVLQYWREDPRTEVVALHLQGFGNPRKFARIARDVGRRTPVVALKSGRGTGDYAVDAMFASAGVIRVDTLAQLFDTCQLLATQPVPAGPRVGIVGTSSALAALAVDACHASALEVVTQVDLGPTADPEELRVALREVAGSGEVDALLALITPHPDGEALAAAVLEASVTGRVPVLASYLGIDGVPEALAVVDGHEVAGRGSVPSYSSPESAALALSRAVAYGAWRARPEGTVPTLEVGEHSLAGLAQDGSWVDTGVLAAYGISPWPTERAATVEQARQAAGRLGWPVALKHPDDAWRNRVDLGAVRLAVDEGDLDAEWARVQAQFGTTDLLVQRMAPPGTSVVVRLVQDPAVGPLLSLRLGGPVADLLADPVVRTLPLTDLDAAGMVRSMRGFALVQSQDVAALEDLLHRLARLAEDLPEVAEVLLDPVLVGSAGVTVLHAGVRLLPPGLDPERRPRQVVGGSAVLLRGTGAT